MYEQYIKQAINIININSDKIVSNSLTYYQNRVIDKATSLYSSDSNNFSYLFTWHKPDIVTDTVRADHLGVSIGTQVGWITSGMDKQYYAKLAKIRLAIKHEVKAQVTSKEPKQ